ncbi:MULTISPECIES: N-acetyl-gamma-glutamyl-phosphate reductase [Stenotrophomonas]|uniref:N-acetyl-gamma-glutamyl-phosphate reductase n=1 Tax=Stenotrophomonas TaxID=40323 RepID=UPI000D370927|nr:MULTISPECIES: N-acetyl-gamma-glutamyl-phosphate reductase [Stenotrophomonas]PTS72298.1 N-acetyl-gamma-glutamyl-phosphate reductase [Stenotrophomonas sp. HMWF023]CAH0180524.1 N-acetyl-gamma-glutamyl-phosphate reductase [Stenotrophomonas lactitubi]CAH0241707.1 N-acetyl-gamma-glutamyl-phosphate reductase [Stenotrophomonas lactitubi]CAH0258955.1 N-acetyl-gamma-glutamyl-phosphate reductase [Stenotrophomonas lactitubi]CAH0262210.1 N-acetyl-gamma-glutamyl-phosphate reductase [Stenotrophomonas lact
MSTSSSFTVGIVGARGHTGAELIRLVAAHPNLQLGFVSSRELAGQRVSDHYPQWQGELQFENLDADAVAAKGVDAVILALPNGLAAPFVAALETAKPDTVIVDLSADYRFDTAWYYGLPELTRDRYNGQKHISNPGCYATAMQLAIHPLRDLLAGPPQCFGVSGYSGAGTSPSDKNNVELLTDNLMPYALTNHVHEREVSVQLGVAVEFMPHVAPHFRGITLTANLWLNRVQTREQIVERFQQAYAGEALIEVVDEAPWVSRIAGRHGAQVGGFTLAPGGKRVVVVATLDNLLKGAATQAMQNLNLALGIDELTSIPH